jgi:hypothetical protein
MSDLTEPVECETHGTSHATFVCQHLARGEGLEFFYDDNPDDPRPDAWCGECDEVMMEDDGWNEENEKSAGITLLCASCYDEVRGRNREPAAWD